MVVRASTAEKHSIAVAAIAPIVFPSLVYLSSSLFMEGPSPLWMLLLTIGATLLGGWMWFERGFILSLKVKGDSIEIFHLLGLEVLPFSLAQALCPIRILGQNDYALVTKNGAVVPLNLGGFLASKNLLDILKMRIQEHNNQTNTKIELPE